MPSMLIYFRLDEMECSNKDSTGVHGIMKIGSISILWKFYSAVTLPSNLQRLMLVDNDDHVNVYYRPSSKSILLSLDYGVLC